MFLKHRPSFSQKYEDGDTVCCQQAIQAWAVGIEQGCGDDGCLSCQHSSTRTRTTCAICQGCGKSLAKSHRRCFVPSSNSEEMVDSGRGTLEGELPAGVKLRNMSVRCSLVDQSSLTPGASQNMTQACFSLSELTVRTVARCPRVSTMAHGPQTTGGSAYVHCVR